MAGLIEYGRSGGGEGRGGGEMDLGRDVFAELLGQVGEWGVDCLYSI